MMTITFFISPERPRHVTSVNPQANEDYLQAAVSMKITIKNATSTTFLRKIYSIQSGRWSIFPPEALTPKSTLEFVTVSDSPFAGTTGTVFYRELTQSEQKQFIQQKLLSETNPNNPPVSSALSLQQKINKENNEINVNDNEINVKNNEINNLNVNNEAVDWKTSKDDWKRSKDDFEIGNGTQTIGESGSMIDSNSKQLPNNNNNQNNINSIENNSNNNLLGLEESIKNETKKSERQKQRGMVEDDHHSPSPQVNRDLEKMIFI